MTISSQENPQINKRIYVKHQSFETFVSRLQTDVNVQKQRIFRILEAHTDKALSPAQQEIIENILIDLKKGSAAEAGFRLTIPIADELSRIDDRYVIRYLINRYRYDVYPQRQQLDDYPPYLQIEPSSICNFRCVFCYQTVRSFTDKSSGHMGTMSFDLFKKIVDQIEGKVDLISLASRGEPFVCKDVSRMLAYCRGKFLGLKVNTNASLLNEEKCHALLSGGVNTIVISADAAEKSLYSQLRVGGKLDAVLQNVKMLRDIKFKHYPQSSVIMRVSGVMYHSAVPNMSSMIQKWGEWADQVCFVKYNPWENVYESPVNNMMTVCSDLWRRMFIWFDGSTNPCDTDYKSTLSVGNILKNTVTELWRGEPYQRLRNAHLEKKRQEVNPCRRCTVV